MLNLVQHLYTFGRMDSHLRGNDGCAVSVISAQAGIEFPTVICRVNLKAIV
jgi:hypothetical protein